MSDIQEKLRHFFEVHAVKLRELRQGTKSNSVAVEIDALHSVFSEITEDLEKAIDKNKKHNVDGGVLYFTGQRDLCNKIIFGIERKMLGGKS